MRIGPVASALTRALALAPAVAVLLASTGAPLQPQAAAEEWRPFGGAWSATGRRHTMATEGHRSASIVELRGSVVLTNAAALGRGFHGEAIGFDDGSGATVGRAVWTDGRGDQVFSLLGGEPVLTERHIVGTITGGTGVYAGLTGDYELTWKFVVEEEDGTVHGQTVDLRGRVRRTGAAP